MRGGILDCRCARRSARRQVGTKGWSYSDRTKGWALQLNSTALATMPNLLNLTHTTFETLPIACDGAVPRAPVLGLDRTLIAAVRHWAGRDRTTDAGC